NNRAANRAAKLIPLEWRPLASLKEVCRVQLAVAQKFVSASVKCIGARARNRVDNSAGGFAIFRRVVARQNREFLNSVHAQVAAENAARRAIGVVVKAGA